MKKLLSVIILALTLVGASVAGSLAGAKWITPDQLEPYASDAIYSKGPLYVTTDGTVGVSFYSVVKLPVGKSVKTIQYTHNGSDATAYTQLFLVRVLRGGNFEQDFLASSTASGEGFHHPETNSIQFAKIKSGYSYYIHVFLNNYSAIGDIKITYK